MNWLSPRAHGAFDYGLGALLIALGLLGLGATPLPSTLLIGFGAAQIALALVTRNGVSPLPLLPLVPHLVIDLLLGITLATIPFWMGFQDQVCWPHFVAGFAILCGAIVTDGAAPLNRRRPA